jgi:hypothetical protein
MIGIINFITLVVKTFEIIGIKNIVDPEWWKFTPVSI